MCLSVGVSVCLSVRVSIMCVYWTLNNSTLQCGVRMRVWCVLSLHVSVCGCVSLSVCTCVHHVCILDT